MKNIQAIKYISLSVLSLAALISFYRFLISPPKSFPAGSIISVESGASLVSISENLKEKEIIRSKGVLQFFAILFGGDRHVVAGDYFFDRPISVWKVAYRIVLGKHHLKVIKITIPEGFGVKDIAGLLAIQFPKIDKAEFLNKAGKLEGYLFPDTYFFYPTMTIDEIISLLSQNFDQKTASLKNDIEKSGHTLGDIITMASLIEKEAGGPGDKTAISGILWKRFEAKIALQVDVAPDTYKYRELPPAPIANPGLDSIKAALYPKETPYLFYLHDKGGEIHYAKTFEEHKLNKLKYLP